MIVPAGYHLNSDGASPAREGGLLRCPQTPGLGLGDAVKLSDDAPLWVGQPRFFEAPPSREALQ